MNQTPCIEVLLDSETISGRVSELASDIANRLPDDLLIVVVLKGSFIFAADLLRALNGAGMEPRVDFITLSSYGSGTRSSGTVSLTRDLSQDIRDLPVMIVDDILDTGRTMAFAMDLMQERGARDVYSCVLLDKHEKREVDIEADYVGFPIGDRFVFGYGIDMAHQYRSLPFIGTIKS